MQPATISRDSARYQRATKGAGQSSCGGGDQHVEGGFVGFVNLVVNPIMFGDLGMHTEVNWLFFCRHVRSSEGSFNPLNAYLRGIHNIFGHNSSFNQNTNLRCFFLPIGSCSN
jgi:hypothetical protein